MEKFIIYGNTDIGTQKTKNQDSFILKVIHVNDNVAILGMICDGLGGLELGELASASVIKGFKTWYMEKFPRLVARSFQEEDIFEDWQQIICSANTKLLQYGKQKGIRLGTTVSGILIYQGHYYCVNVGDSRVYEINSCLRQITKDQSLIQREIDSGRLTEEESLSDTRQNILLECVGAKDDVHPEFYQGTIAHETSFLFCSDGFRHVISKDEIFNSFNPEKLVSKEIAKNQVDQMISLIKERGETDNITAGVIKIC